MQQLSIPELAASFETGESVYLAGASGEANELTSMLADPRASLADAHFASSFIPGINTRCLARPGHRSRLTVFFMQPVLRAALAEGRVDFRPMNYFGIQRHLSDAATPFDTTVVQITPPDAAGRCSLGPAVEFMPGVIAHAARVIGIVNSALPRLPGAASIPMDCLSAVAYSDAPPSLYEVGRPSAVATQIVAHLAPLIPNGATVQVGLGKVPAQLLEALAGHRNLALHTGLISDAALGLAGAGALRRERAIVTAVAVGSAELYSRLPELHGLEITDVGVTHSPQTLGGLRRFHAVNSALEVDLLGQVNAEVIDGRYVSGPGGLPDFAHAAHAADDGLSIIALNSTDAGGSVSRIVTRLGNGAPVTLPQHEVDAVVTEYGVAMLRGQSVEERARRLCAIAHPQHRPALRRSMENLAG